MFRCVACGQWLFAADNCGTEESPLCRACYKELFGDVPMQNEEDWLDPAGGVHTAGEEDPLKQYE